MVSGISENWGTWTFEQVQVCGVNGCVWQTDVKPLTCPFNETNSNYTDALVVLTNKQLSVRIGFTDDLSDATMNFFANSLGCGTSYCATEPANSINDVTTNYITSSSANYKYYIHTGACHAEREASGSPAGCNYNDMTQSGVAFNTWIRGWLQVPGFAWNDVH
jgi:hypothetical protein